MAARFQKPDVAELAAYAAELGWPEFEADRFHDYYELVGWVVGKGKPMRDWKAAVRLWRRNARDWGKPAGKTAAEQRAADQAARREREQREARQEAQTVRECAEQLRSLRSWRGKGNSPYGDLAEEERRLLAKWRDQYGAAVVGRILDATR